MPVAPEKLSRLAAGMLIAIAGVVLLIGLAMAFYPVPYSWPRHFLSALGLTALKDGASNLVSCLLFNTALAAAGLASAVYYWSRGMAMTKLPLRIAYLLFGLAGSAALAAIGLTPYNLWPDLHNNCTYVTTGLGLAMLLTVFQPDSVFGRRAENWIWLLFSLFTGAIWLALFAACHHRLLPYTPTAQIMQKMIVGFFLLYMIFQAAALLFRSRRPPA